MSPWPQEWEICGLFIFYLGRTQLLSAPAIIFILEFLSTGDRLQLLSLGPIYLLPHEIKTSADLVFPKSSFLGLQIVVFLLCLHVASSLCVSSLGVCPFSYKDTSHIWLRPTHMTSFNFNYLFKGPVSKYSHILRLLMVRTSTYKCWGRGCFTQFNLQQSACSLLFFWRYLYLGTRKLSWSISERYVQS